MKGPAAAVPASVLRWARETAGLAEDEAARRIGVSAQRLGDAEAGDAQLTLNQARKAAEVYKRPFATLFLPAPLQEEPIEVQFRRLRDAPSPPWSPEMRALARRMPALQDEADALYEALEQEPTWLRVREALQRFDRGAGDSSAFRELVGVTLSAQKDAARADPQGFRAFRLWREAIEDLGVLVLQDGSLPVSEMRGFLSPHPRVPAIVVNTNDDIRARLFTMLHEFAHLVVTAGGEMGFEEFAAAVLMPEPDFGRDFAATAAPSLLARVDIVARVYGVTSHAAAIRAGWLGLVSWPDVQAVVEQLRARGGAATRTKGGDYYRNVVSRLGPGFVSRILAAVDQGAFSELAAARLLGVRVEAFGEVRTAARGVDAA